MSLRYFSGAEQLRGNVLSMPNAEFDVRFPGVVGRRFDSFSRMVMRDVDGALRPVERAIDFKANPSLHECDARCLHATGKTMRCECSCGGRNHGRGSVAEAVPAPTTKLVTIGWYRDGKLIDTHTLRPGAAEAAIRGKQSYLEVRHATPGYPGLRQTLAAQDAALAVLLSAAA